MRSSREELLKSIKEHVAILKEKQRMRKMYPAGTCNAEDAWNDFSHRADASEKNLRRLSRCK